MPSWLIELLKLLGDKAPFVVTAVTYALVAYLFFHWLDTKASEAAKNAVSNWLQQRTYKKEQVGDAIIEMFNQIYTHRLLSWKAFARSALITICISALLLYESLHHANNYLYMVFDFNTTAGSSELVSLVEAIVTNIIVDYLSLFVVKRLLIFGRNSPELALWVGPLVGILIVGLSLVI
jgi:hypothetical protein